MHAVDIMTSPVITAGPNANILDIVKLMLDNRISAVPIVGRDGSLLGLVSEGDLIRRSEIGARDYSSWWLSAIGGTITLAEDFVKSHGVRASEIMTEKVITVQESARLWQIAETLEKNKIKRVPVMRDGQVAGIVSRANLLQALAAQREKQMEAPSRDDRMVREELLKLLEGERWSDLSHLNVVVLDGVVHYWGLVHSGAERDALKAAAESVAGVSDVIDHTHTSVTLIGVP
ncbi:MAG: CBS domain-containing protein [Hyphomicrobiales bacterium]